MPPHHFQTRIDVRFLFIRFFTSQVYCLLHVMTNARNERKIILKKKGVSVSFGVNACTMMLWAEIYIYIYICTGDFAMTERAGTLKHIVDLFYVTACF